MRVVEKEVAEIRAELARVEAERLPTRYLTPPTERFLALLGTAAHEHSVRTRL